MLRLLCLLSTLQALSSCLEQRRRPETVEHDKGIPVPGGRPPPTLIIFSCTLEELYKGTQKSIDATVQEMDALGYISKVTKTYQLEVKPGWKKGTRITYPGQGDQEPGSYRRDLTFVLDEAAHSRFRRDGNNLVVQHTVSLADALSGFSITLTHLDGRQLPVIVTHVIAPGETTVLKGEGMPHKEGVGDLIVEFDMEFPKRLKSKEQCAVLADLDADTC